MPRDKKEITINIFTLTVSKSHFEIMIRGIKTKITSRGSTGSKIRVEGVTGQVITGYGSKESKGHRSRGHRSCIKRITCQVANVKGLKIFERGTSTIILSISF